jgi:iron complex transport system permease protein
VAVASSEIEGSRHVLLMPVLAVLVVGSALASLALGAVSLSPARVVAVLLGEGDVVARIIVLELRVPRAALSLLVGAMLGLAGAALQGYLRNPLAEPSVLGASNAAALGAVAAIYFGLAEWHVAVLPLLSVGTGIVAPAVRKAR